MLTLTNMIRELMVYSTLRSALTTTMTEDVPKYISFKGWEFLRTKHLSNAEALAIHCREPPKNKVFVYDWVDTQ